jgi:hypothetical protein
MTRIAFLEATPVLLVFSQDQDLAEAAEEVEEMARREKRAVEIHCAFPTSPTAQNTRGLRLTHWLPFDKPTYDACLDPRPYRDPPR